MSKYYRGRRKSNIFDPRAKEPFRLSRSKIDLFLECPRCFYVDRKLGVDRPPGFPFSLNIAVDLLLKKEIDTYRKKQEPYPLAKANGVDAVPFQHEKINEWRDAMRGGILYLHKSTNLLISGGIDDLWVNPSGELHIVEYKATAKTESVNIDADWQEGYKRQMEVYQWLFRQNGFKVSQRGFFLYCNGSLTKETFDNKLEFETKIIPYEGKDEWVEPVIHKIHECLVSDNAPPASENCDFCLYRRSVAEVARQVQTTKE
ncbi:MAG: PD-(D/E)XK nuclease family protein [Candidatus Omnitrophica bacterium]|nr:PD-(D/E)XK nuclease family protein [Candidatus Omnitrophota bacterium]